MAKQVLTDVRAYLSGADLTGNSNKIELVSEVDDQDVTTMASNGWKEVIGGLFDTTITAEGFWEAGDASKVDDASYAGIGAVAPWTIVPTGGTVSSVAYLTKALQTNYVGPQGNVGDVAGWSANGKGSWPVARGVVAHPNGTARTATGTGTALNLGALAAGQYMYASLHVLSIAGTATPTITARVESDDNSGFTTPTTRGTFAAATSLTGEIMRIAGAITDTYWRIAWTITGTNPSFLFVSALGIK